MQNLHEKFTEIKEYGEFGLIDHLTEKIKLRNDSTAKAFGDDAAILDYKRKLTVVSSDMLLEGVHFDLIYFPLHHLGYKAVISGISDIYAMNAMAEQVIVSIAVSKKLSVEMIDDIYMGMRIACENYGVDMVGGDTCSSLTGLTINVTSLGMANKSRLVYRDGAKNFDLICVTGDLGGAFTGLQLLEREKKVYMENPEVQPELEGNEYILQRQLKPEARKDIIEIFSEKKIKPTAMMDISDGLASELFHLCKQSGTGCKVFSNKLPIDQQTFSRAKELNLDLITCALNGGEDYELVFTVSQKDYEKIKKIKEISVIGHMTGNPKEYNLVTNSGNEVGLQAQGWQAFQ